MYVGKIIHTSDGISKYMTKGPMLTFSPIHNIVVVISPIGDQAPPAFAATIIIPAYHSFKFLSFISFWRIVINTIVAVRLSIIADRKNAKKHIIQRIFTLFFVEMSFLIPLNPLK